ncbi:MAG: hypothetical protein WCT31_01555 [Candidatus Micrarchaeia archaeon]|jgi:hypothetical protein
MLGAMLANAAFIGARTIAERKINEELEAFKAGPDRPGIVCPVARKAFELWDEHLSINLAFSAFLSGRDRFKPAEDYRRGSESCFVAGLTIESIWKQYRDAIRTNGPEIRGLVRALTPMAANQDFLDTIGEIKEIIAYFDWVAKNISYSEDVANGPEITVATRIGNCKAKTLLLASMLENAGYYTSFLLVPGHVFLMVDVPVGLELSAREEYKKAGNYLMKKYGTTMDNPIFVDEHRGIFRLVLEPTMEDGWRGFVPNIMPYFMLDQKLVYDLAFVIDPHEHTVRKLDGTLVAWMPK